MYLDLSGHIETEISCGLFFICLFLMRNSNFSNETFITFFAGILILFYEPTCKKRLRKYQKIYDFVFFIINSFIIITNTILLIYLLYIDGLDIFTIINIKQALHYYSEPIFMASAICIFGLTISVLFFVRKILKVIFMMICLLYIILGFVFFHTDKVEDVIEYIDNYIFVFICVLCTSLLIFTSLTKEKIMYFRFFFIFHL